MTVRSGFLGNWRVSVPLALRVSSRNTVTMALMSVSSSASAGTASEGSPTRSSFAFPFIVTSTVSKLIAP